MFGLSRLEADLIAIVLAVAAALIWLEFHDSEVRSAATAPIIAGVKAAEASANAAQTAREAAQAASQAEALTKAQDALAKKSTDAASLDATVRLLRIAAGYGAQSSRSIVFSPAYPGPAASVPGTDVVPRQLLISAEQSLADTAQDASDLAKYAECLRTAGQLCATDYGISAKP